MRLIDADELKQQFVDKLVRVGLSPEKAEEFAKTAFDATFKTIDAMPTIEAEPIKHGRWIYIRDEENNGLYECSECHKRDIHAKECEVPYCWNCGARMDEQQEVK